MSSTWQADASGASRTTRGSDYAPRWLPDGRIGYVNEAPDGELNVLKAVDPGGRHSPTVLSGIATSAQWSPDGTKIAFEIGDPDRSALQTQVWVMNADGSDRRMIVRDASMDGAQPDWSPDSRRIAFVAGANRNYSIQTVNADGSGRSVVTRSGGELGPDWSPDGRRILYAQQLPMEPHWHLGIVEADGTHAHNLTSGFSNDMTPAWSPSGRQIAFTSDRSRNQEIWVVRADGSRASRVTYGGCTIIGTPRSDDLRGMPGRDVICGLGGHDAIRGGSGDDRLVGGLGDDRIYGESGDDAIFGEEGADVLDGGAGSDSIDAGPGDDSILTRDGRRDLVDGRAGIDSALGDRRDFAFDVERGNLASHHHPAPPTKAEIVARTKAAVKASRATLVRLEVVMPRISYSLTVKVSDPAAYLRHRVNTLLEVMQRVTNLPEPFRDRDFILEDGSGNQVLTYSERKFDRGTRSTWSIDPRYVDCARGIALDIEVDPDHAAPPCPVP